MRVLIALWLGFVEDVVLSVLLEIFRVLFFPSPFTIIVSFLKIIL